MNQRDDERALPELPTFNEWWMTKALEGYSYGHDALENVRMGYEAAIGLARAAAPSVPAPQASAPASEQAGSLEAAAVFAIEVLEEVGNATLEWNDGPYSPKRGDELRNLCVEAIDTLSAARAAAPSVPAPKAVAYAVYFPNEQREEIVRDLDDLVEDMTNCRHEVTPLYAGPPAPTPASDQEESDLQLGADAPSRDRLDAAIDAAMSGAQEDAP